MFIKAKYLLFDNVDFFFLSCELQVSHNISHVTIQCLTYKTISKQMLKKKHFLRKDWALIILLFDNFQPIYFSTIDL